MHVFTQIFTGIIMMAFPLHEGAITATYTVGNKNVNSYKRANDST
jgi:hypothetical protein